MGERERERMKGNEKLLHFVMNIDVTMNRQNALGEMDANASCRCGCER